MTAGAWTVGVYSGNVGQGRPLSFMTSDDVITAVKRHQSNYLSPAHSSLRHLTALRHNDLPLTFYYCSLTAVSCTC